MRAPEAVLRVSTICLALTVLFASLAFASPPDLRSPDSGPASPRSGQLGIPRVGGRDIALPFLLGAGALVASRYEDPEAVQSGLDGSGLDAAIDFGNWYGGSYVLGSTAAALFAWGELGDDPGMSGVGKDLAKSLAMTWAVVGVLKVAVDAERPDGGRHSFPSGHTATAFAAAPVFAAHGGSRVGVLAYTTAAFTGLGRLEDRRHYVADVLFGAAIGVFMGREASRGERRHQLHVDRQGLSLRFEF